MYKHRTYTRYVQYIHAMYKLVLCIMVRLPNLAGRLLTTRADTPHVHTHICTHTSPSFSPQRAESGWSPISNIETPIPLGCGGYESPSNNVLNHENGPAQAWIEPLRSEPVDTGIGYLNTSYKRPSSAPSPDLRSKNMMCVYAKLASP